MRINCIHFKRKRTRHSCRTSHYRDPIYYLRRYEPTIEEELSLMDAEFEEMDRELTALAEEWALEEEQEQVLHFEDSGPVDFNAYDQCFEVLDRERFKEETLDFAI